VVKSQLVDVQFFAVVFGHPFNHPGQSDHPFQSFNPFNNKIWFFFIYMSMRERDGGIGRLG